MELDNIELDGQNFKGLNVKTEHAFLLMIQAKQGFLGCGYFNIETANKLKESVAIVSGVSNYKDCLDAMVILASEEAIKKGITLSMTGREALKQLNL